MTDLVNVPREGQNTNVYSKVDTFETRGAVETASDFGRYSVLSDYLQTSPSELGSLLGLTSGRESSVMDQFRTPLIIGEDGNIINEQATAAVSEIGDRKLKRVSRNEQRSLPGEAALADSVYGVQTSRTREGFTRKGITTTSGENHFLSLDKNGLARNVRDSTGEWRSSDGKTWTNTENGVEKKGKYDIKYGAISFSPESNETTILTGSSSVHDQISVQQGRI